MTALYSRLAATGIRRNGRAYAPYILTCSLMIMIFYIISYLSGNELLYEMEGGGGMAEILSVGVFVMAIFSGIFLFYTNSFLIKRRKREFGLYNILGLGKRQIMRILVWETLLVYVISLIAGLGFGILFSKLAEMLAVRMLGNDLVYTFSVSVPSVIVAVIWFAVVFTAILLNSLRQLFFSRPVELLHSENTGERPPRTNIPGAALGVLLLGIAYFMALTIKHPAAALGAFTIAVILVIAATYLLFIAGSVVMCRILQKNKGYYYKTNHFVSISQMAFRMRRNGAGLASICILSTMVLVTISSTASLYIGINGYVARKYPNDIQTDIYIHSPGKNTFEEVRDVIDGAMRELSCEPRSASIRTSLPLTGLMLREHMGIPLPDPNTDPNANYFVSGSFYTADEHPKLAEAGVKLGEREIAVYEPATDWVKSRETVTVGELGEFKVIPVEYKELDSDEIYSDIEIPVYFLVNDMQTLWDIFGYLSGTEAARSIHQAYGFDLSDGKLPQSAADEVYDSIMRNKTSLYNSEILDYENVEISIGTATTFRNDYYGFYSGLFFLGIIMGGVFILAAALIMYYKQISEGFEDAARFEILRKVGMSRREIKSAINSQVLTVFFLPLAAAGVHMAFAFPILSRLLRLFEMTDTHLFAIMTLASFAVFAAMYVLFYKLTSRSYLNIVGGNKK